MLPTGDGPSVLAPSSAVGLGWLSPFFFFFLFLFFFLAPSASSGEESTGSGCPGGDIWRQMTADADVRRGDARGEALPADTRIQRGAETSAEVLVSPPGRMVSNAGPQQWYYRLYKKR